MQDTAPAVRGAPRAAATTEPRRHDRGHRRWLVLTVPVVLAGYLGQALVWISDPLFWNDEIYLAVNLRLAWRELAGPLTYFQSAPLVWLAGEKLIYELLGTGERALRLPSLISAAVALTLVVVLARRAVGRRAAVFAAVLAGSAPGLLYYAGEFKHYATEAAAAVAVLLVGLLLVEVPAVQAPRGRRTRRIAVYVAVTLVAALLTYNALLVLAGVGAGLVGLLAVQRRRRDLVLMLLATAPAALVAVLLALHRLSLPLIANQYDIFFAGFPQPGAGPAELVDWPVRMWRAFVAWPLGWTAPVLVLCLVLAGLVALAARRSYALLAMLVGVWVAALGAAAIRQYPLENRLALYLVGPTVLTVAAALDGAVRLVRRSAGRWPRTAATAGAVAAALATVLVVQPAVDARATQVRAPRNADTGGETLREVAARRAAGDVFLLYPYSQPLGAWYGPQFRVPVAGRLELVAASACTPSSVDARVAGARRLWYVYASTFSGHPHDYHQRVAAALSRYGRVVEVSERYRGGPVAGWVLVDLTAGPQPVPLPSDPRWACLNVR